MNKMTSILLVDDDPAILQVYSEILRAEGYEVWEASTGQQGLQAARERRPDLVLLDVMLPDLSGIEVCRQIKTDAALADIFVVLVSGAATSVVNKVDGLGTGADDYLLKPLDLAEFLARLRTIVRLRNTTAALRASEQRHRQLVEILPEAVGLIDLQGRLLAVNPQGAEMLGYGDLDELLGRTVFDLTHPEDHERLRADLTTAPEIGTFRNARFRLLRKGGDSFPAEVSTAVAADARGQPSGIVLVARDITERKRAEEALQGYARFLANNARFLQTLMDAIPAPVFYKDAGGRYLGCNRAFEQHLGYLQDQIIRKTAGNAAPKNLPEVYQRADLELLARPGVQTYESSVVYADGKRHQVIFNKATFQNAEGEVAGLVGVILDITERKRAEEQIQLLADAVQSTQELVSITDQDNRFTFVNQAFLQAYGYPVEEIMGRTPGFLYSAKNPPGLTDLVFQQTLRGGWKGEIVNCRKDGTEFPISLNTSPIKNSEGRTLGLVGVARDITERIRTEKRSAAFAHLGYRLSAASTREQAANVILDIGSELFGWDAGYVNLYSPDQDQITPLLTVDTGEGGRVLFPPTSWPLKPSPMMRRVMKEGAQLLNPGSESLRTSGLVPFGNVDRRSVSMMFVPIHARGAVIGILSIQRYTPPAYSQEDLKLLQTLADYCGDTLQRIEMADSLRQAEAKYRSIVENITEGIFQTTPDGRFRSANPALAHMLGYQTPEELMAEVTDLEKQFYVKSEKRQELMRLLGIQDSVRAFEFEHYRKDGSVIWVSVNGHAIRDANGTLQYYEGTIEDITKRKAAEEALEMSQVLQDALLDNIPDPAWLKDAEGRFLACNEPLARFLGQPRHAIIGRTLFDLDPQEAARLTAEDKKVMQAGTPGRFEWRRIDPQGRVGWFETIKSPLLDEQGDATGTVGIARDMTERKWVENLLRHQRDFGIFLSSTDDLGAAAERLLKVALENDNLDCGAVYLVNSQTNALEFIAHRGLSAGFVKRASLFAPDPVRDHLAGARQAASREQVGPMARIVRLLKREGLLAQEVLPIQHGGQVVAVLNVGSRVHSAIPAKTRQAIEMLAAQAGGAIARIRAEQSMRTSRQLLERTIHSLHAAVFLIDAHTTTIQECNPAATRLFGHSREEMIGQSPALLHLNEAIFEEFWRHLQAAVKEKGLLSDFEFMMKRKDGTTFSTEQNLVPIRNEAGRTVIWVATVRDITEHKRIEQDLRQLSGRIIEAQEAERQRVARELHDSVNQVIASAKMRLRKVETYVAPNPVARELLARCDELLVQALEENRRIAHNLRPTDLDALGLTDACRNFCQQFQARTNLVVKIRLARFARRCPPATELNLFRIVQEALNNIEKHAHARIVRLQIASQRSGLMLRIQDDGRGFDPKAAKRAGRKRKGLGLTNMQERAAILGGTCEVVSVPNQGTTITVRVPLSSTGRRPPTTGF
jgi:PAS domain S-box-containing protein